MADIQEYYQILGLQYGASLEEIKIAYRRLVKEHHPDRFPYDSIRQKQAEEKIIKINIAYEALLDYQPKTPELDRQHSYTNIHVDTTKTNAKKCYDRGVIAVEKSNDKEAIEYFSQAIRLNPKYIEAYQYRGFLREKMGLARSAEADFQMAWQLKREDLNNRYPSKITTNPNRTNTPNNYRKSTKKQNLWQILTRYIKKLIRSIKSIFFR
jgi:curved DNA-binding protein CbpA